MNGHVCFIGECCYVNLMARVFSYNVLNSCYSVRANIASYLWNVGYVVSYLIVHKKVRLRKEGGSWQCYEAVFWHQHQFQIIIWTPFLVNVTGKHHSFHFFDFFNYERWKMLLYLSNFFVPCNFLKVMEHSWKSVSSSSYWLVFIIWIAY